MKGQKLQHNRNKNQMNRSSSCDALRYDLKNTSARSTLYPVRQRSDIHPKPEVRKIIDSKSPLQGRGYVTLSSQGGIYICIYDICNIAMAIHRLCYTKMYNVACPTRAKHRQKNIHRPINMYHCQNKQLQTSEQNSWSKLQTLVSR